MPTDASRALIEDLVLGYTILVNEHVLDSFGHVSVRSPDDPDKFLMPRAMPPSLVTADDIVTFDIADSRPLDADGRRVNGERFLHGEILKARPDVNAVIHSHSQATLPFSIGDVPLKPVVIQAGFMRPETPNFEIRDVRGSGRGAQITDIPRAVALANALGDGPLALLRGHGNVVVGSSVRQAVVYAVYIDINARMQMDTIALGADPIPLDEPEFFTPEEFDINRPWQNFVQKMLDDRERAAIDRGQFGLDHTQ